MLLIFRKNHEATFLLSRFSLTKSAAKVSKEDLRRPPSEPCPVSATPTNALRALVNSRGVHELVAGCSAWQVCATNGKAKVGSLTLPAISYYHACEHITRKSRADSCTHCLHALPKQEPMLSFLHKYAKAHSTFALSA